MSAMSEDRSYVERNTGEQERLRALVARLTDDELRRQVNDHWTVAGVLGHIAFWDARVLALADKVESGVPFSPSDAEPEDVDWINDATRPLIHAIAPRQAAELAVQLAEETDRRVASLAPGCGPTTPTARSIPCAPPTAASTSTTSKPLWADEPGVRGGGRRAQPVAEGDGWGRPPGSCLVTGSTTSSKVMRAGRPSTPAIGTRRPPSRS